MTEKHRTLVISPNWIGDAVMAQPLLRLLKQAHPERAIDVLAPPQVVPVWRRIQEADDILVTPFRHRALQLGERWRYARILKERGYSDAYVLPNTLKYALIPWLARIPRRVGYKGEMRYGMVNVMHHDDKPRRSMVPFYAAGGGTGVLILSEFAGAAVELHGALLANPYDSHAMTSALHQALTMREDERAYRTARMAMIVAEHDVVRWGDDFLAAVDNACVPVLEEVKAA
ncbi:hypothetical protein GCM10025794_28520 [Massilia kyonggiensis]